MSSLIDKTPTDLALAYLKLELDYRLWSGAGKAEAERQNAIDQHIFFVNTLIDNFDEIFKTPITDETYDKNEIKIVYQEGSDDNKWNYELVLFGKYHYFCCNSYTNLHKLLKWYAIEEQELFYYTPLYLYSFIKDEYKIQHHKEIIYPEPDLETDEEDHPLYDTDDCPVCMEKFGITEKQELVGNHPNKKILKTTKTICVKRNTFCGHPICMKCFKTICNSCNVSCPMCRENYEDTGDVEIDEWDDTLNEEELIEMVENQDDMLLDMVDLDPLIEQSVIADGWEHMLRCEGFCLQGDTFFFGKDED